MAEGYRPVLPPDAKGWECIQYSTYLRPLINGIFGSDKINYERAHWFNANAIVDTDDTLIELPGAEADPYPHPLADLIPRLKKEVVVVSAGLLSLNELIDQVDGQFAVATTFGDTKLAGVLPADLPEYYGSVSRFKIGLRSGRQPFGVGIGVWSPSDRTMIVADDSQIEKQHVPIDRLWPTLFT